MLDKKTSGNYGEDLAAKFLAESGFLVIERNFRIRNGEIDIVAIDNRMPEKTLVCVEVKSRSSHEYGTPLESITYFKLKALQRTLQFYKASRKNLPALMRIDVVTVERNSAGGHKLEHFQNISG